ncbi:MAG: hypothetical protein JW825_00965 [Candidatus Methanofastidiosa archaeon]|nr:hypothetical protein [Candidatus Methanofastidiosa archaeon]
MGQITRASELLLGSLHAIALTGAGMSTESGIPDYRGPNGLWTKDPLAEKRAYDAYRTFVEDPDRYWREGFGRHPLLESFLKASPNIGHHCLARLERMCILKKTITQNIDGLHERAGSRDLIEYHGNAFKLRCLRCNNRISFGSGLFEGTPQILPTCKKCGSVLKSDVVYFGEPIPPDIIRECQRELNACDVMLICGTSAVVHPFASMPYILKKEKGDDATVIEINHSDTPLTRDGISDIFIRCSAGKALKGICDTIGTLI